VVSPENLHDLLREPDTLDIAGFQLPEMSQAEGNANRSNRGDVSRDEVEAELVEIWRRTLGIEEIGVHDNFFEIGGHSLLAARIVSQIDKRFKKRLSIAAIFRAPTIAQLAATLRGVPAPNVIPITRREGHHTSLLWLDRGAIYQALARRLEDHLAMISVTPPDKGRATFSSPYRLEDIAQCLAEKILEIQPEGPYFLGGWCLPGLVAYETARQLELKGKGESLVILIDTPISFNHEEAVSLSTRLIRRMKREAFHFAHLWNMPRENRSRYLRARFELAKRLWQNRKVRIEYNRATEDRTQPRSIDDIQYLAALGYNPSPLRGRVLFLQPQLRPDDPYWDFSIGWRKLTELEVVEIPGDHTSMFEEPNVGVLAERIRLAIEDMQSRRKPTKVTPDAQLYAIGKG